MEKEAFKYFAFISYSHKDQKVAKKLQRRLERYHLPSALQKSYPELPKSLKPIFIDESNLVARGSLQTALQANLERSNYLILICSPNSAKSEYVNDEVDYFIKNGRVDHIIPLIVDGAPHSDDDSAECFPPALMALPREQEPLGIDLKKHGVRDAFLRVIATMLELDLDNFISQEARERKKRTMIFASIAAALVILAGILAWYSKDFVNELLYNDVMQYRIALSYYQKQDYKRALEWFEKSAANGNSDAQYSIGAMYV
ncbi:MAG: toll/interleukin-1 receptor domain-containing protein, partial [Synergistaceae bacterium]|nr:toll/interleukin-1 receptor domain-containing protein [Synergistaceae bacterium]